MISEKFISPSSVHDNVSEVVSEYSKRHLEKVSTGPEATRTQLPSSDFTLKTFICSTIFHNVLYIPSKDYIKERRSSKQRLMLLGMYEKGLDNLRFLTALK